MLEARADELLESEERCDIPRTRSLWCSDKRDVQIAEEFTNMQISDAIL
jgi:hypothetical protein